MSKNNYNCFLCFGKLKQIFTMSDGTKSNVLSPSAGNICCFLKLRSYYWRVNRCTVSVLACCCQFLYCVQYCIAALGLSMKSLHVCLLLCWTNCYYIFVLRLKNWIWTLQQMRNISWKWNYIIFGAKVVTLVSIWNIHH